MEFLSNVPSINPIISSIIKIIKYGVIGMVAICSIDILKNGERSIWWDARTYPRFIFKPLCRIHDLIFY